MHVTDASHNGGTRVSPGIEGMTQGTIHSINTSNVAHVPA